jgi:hypothetical protein
MTDFDSEWERCRQYLEPALDHAWTIDAVEAEIRQNRATLWPMERSAAVTALHEYPNGRVLRLWLAGGDLDELRHFMPAADNYARWQGCIAVECEGRVGWERVLPAHGYTKRRVVMVKMLDKEPDDGR